LKKFEGLLQNLQESDEQEYLVDVGSFHDLFVSTIKDLMISVLEPIEKEFLQQYDGVQESFIQDNTEIHKLQQSTTENFNHIQEQLLTESKEQINKAYHNLLLQQALFYFEKISDSDRKPFKEEYNLLHTLVKQVPELNPYLSQLPPNSETIGFKSYSELQDEFNKLRYLANEQGQDSNFYTHIIVRPDGLEEGDDIQSLLSRASYYVSRASFANAIKQIHKMPPIIQTIFQDWISSTEQRLQLETIKSNLAEHIRHRV